MTFSAIVSAGTIEQFVENANTLVYESRLHLAEDGLELSATDPANVALLEQSLSAGAFESYEADGGTIGVSLDRLADVLGMADSSELVFLDLDEETRKLHIEVGGLEYDLALIDPDQIREEPSVPDVLESLTAHLVIEARHLQAAEKAAGLCSDHITIGADADREVFFTDAEGDTDRTGYEWPTDGDRVLANSRIDADARSLFSLDYVRDVLKPIRSGAEITVHVGEEFPVFFDSEFADGHGDLRYCVSPRVKT